MDESEASRQSDDARAARILDAAASLIAHYGYDKTTVSDIAREAGVSKGAIYLHWRSKDELVEALFWRDIWNYMDDWLARLEADPEGGTFRGMFKHAALALESYPFLKAVMGRDMRVIGSMVQRGRFSFASESLMVRTEMFSTLQSLGAVRADVDPEVAAYAFACFRYGLLKIGEVVPPEKAPPLETVITFIAEMLERSLAPEDGAANVDAVRQLMHHMGAQLREQVNQARQAGPAAPEA